MSAENFSWLDGMLMAISAVIALILLRPAVRDAPFWRATVTPLASIIGSGFLVVVPLLASIAGTLSGVAISAIALLSLWLGSALRFNIRYCDWAARSGDRLIGRLERLSDLVLAGAYFISIAFYIRLLCGFALTGVGAYTTLNADILATGVLAFIGIYGWRRGLHGLERLEEYSVTIKLAIIAALIIGLLVYDNGSGYDLSALSRPRDELWERCRQLAGMLLIVQGFETSKYLGSDYSAPLRARTMAVAQVLAAAIYVVFVTAAMPLMTTLSDSPPSETAIIELSAVVTLALPIMLVIAATMSQFSAAIADTIGAGGVLARETTERLTPRRSYPLIAALAVALIWASDIFEIIALASRAFALYYLLQVLVVLKLSGSVESGKPRWRYFLSYGCLAAIMLFVMIFAVPAAG